MITGFRKVSIRRGIFTMLVITAALLPSERVAQAEKIQNQVAIFAALDKVTARISRLEIALGETVRFGALKVTPRVCYTRPPTEPPKTTTFVEVKEIKLDGTEDKLYTGWLFAQSPGLSGVEHPVFDVWLTDCARPERVARPVQQAEPNKPTRERRRRRRRRRQ